MFKKKDDIKTFIVIIIVCIICVFVALFFNKRNNYDNIEKVSDYNVFFANVSIVNNYLTYVANNNSEAVYSLLNKSYIRDNGINKDNVLDLIDDYSVLSSFEVSSMDYVKVNKDYIYSVEGKIYENVYDSARKLVDDDFKLIIITDTSKNTYSLYPVNDNTKDVINGIMWIRISNNDYNVLSETFEIDKEKICTIYFSNYMNYVYNDIDYAYGLISDEMKKVYNDKKEYIDYIYDNFYFLSSTADRCKLAIQDDYKVYIVVDTNGNTYQFTENSIMNYKVDFYLNKNE